MTTCITTMRCMILSTSVAMKFNNLTSFLQLLESISGCCGEIVRGWFGVILQLD